MHCELFKAPGIALFPDFPALFPVTKVIPVDLYKLYINSPTPDKHSR
jgi:hypothetical protein